MKKLLTICLVLMMLCLHAQSMVQTNEPIVDRWEIVTDIYIGVQTEVLTQEERHVYGANLPNRQGLRIKRIIQGSPAEEAGLQVGDLILKNNGARIATMEDLLLSVRNTRPGEIIHFDILRGDKKLPVSIRVGGLPEPVVVAHATQRQRNTPSLSTISGNQKRIASLLSEDIPNLKAIHEEFYKINQQFPNLARPGHIRLYYQTDFGYLTVTAYPSKVTVTVQRKLEVESYHLEKQGDSLPVLLREIFQKL